MSNKNFKLETIPHFRFTAYLSDNTLALLKTHVLRVMRDQLDEPLVEDFLNWTKQLNETFLHASYSTAEFALPQNFDTFFWIGSEEYEYASVYIPFAVINGWSPTLNISRGHKYVCLLQFQESVLEKVKQLPEVNGGIQMQANLILTKREYLPFSGG